MEYTIKASLKILVPLIIVFFTYSCKNSSSNGEQNKIPEKKELAAKDILGNPDYLAMSYGGYRHADHDIEPTLEEFKEDMKLLSAMGVKIIRTYKVHLPQASNILKALTELKKEDPGFEMYVMLGAWIDC